MGRQAPPRLRGIAEKKISEMIATPKAPPICWMAWSAPEPEPASAGGTVISTIWNIEAMAMPSPMPPRNSGSMKAVRSSVSPTPPTARCKRRTLASSKAAPMAMRMRGHCPPSRP